MDTADNSQFWGLDPVFRASAKMYIGDIMNMTSAEGVDSVFVYNGHTVRNVDVMGVVVHADIKAKYSSYVLDDGTGTIFCTHWPSNNNEPQLADVPADLTRIVADKAEEYALGTALHVRGKLRRYQGNNEISVSYMRKVIDPYEEIYRMMELPVLYKQSYDTTPEIPDKNADDRKANVQNSFNRFLVEYLQNENVESVNEHLLISSSKLKNDFLALHGEEMPDEGFSSLVKQALTDLSVNGMMYCTHENYTFIPLAFHLEAEVLALLRRNTSEDGMQDRRLLQELKARLEYSQLTLPALNKVLANMESKSDIISVSENHYIAFG